MKRFTRMIVKLWIVAATLFMVMTRGRLITFALPSFSRDVSRAVSECAPSSEPSARSRAEPEPAPNPLPKLAGIGKLARKGTPAGVAPVPFGGGAEPVPTFTAANTDRARKLNPVSSP
jgi:hypothetical protein